MTRFTRNSVCGAALIIRPDLNIQIGPLRRPVTTLTLRADDELGSIGSDNRRPGGNARNGEEFHGVFDSAQFDRAEALASDVVRQVEC